MRTLVPTGIQKLQIHRDMNITVSNRQHHSYIPKPSFANNLSDPNTLRLQTWNCNRPLKLTMVSGIRKRVIKLLNKCCNLELKVSLPLFRICRTTAGVAAIQHFLRDHPKWQDPAHLHCYCNSPRPRLALPSRFTVTYCGAAVIRENLEVSFQKQHIPISLQFHSHKFWTICHL